MARAVHQQGPATQPWAEVVVVQVLNLQIIQAFSQVTVGMEFIPQ
jgi:hypothetical protein